MIKNINCCNRVSSTIVLAVSLLSLSAHADSSKQVATASCDVNKNSCSGTLLDSNGHPVQTWTSWWTTVGAENKRLKLARNKPTASNTDPAISDTVACELDKGNGITWHISTLGDHAAEITPQATVTVQCLGWESKQK